jgi:hypothetical protein
MNTTQIADTAASGQSALTDGLGERNRSEMMTEKRTVWVAYTNTDCTEGRGHDVPIAVCAAEATALRLSRKQYVQGSDGPVRTMDLVKIDGKWYAPSAAINVVEPTREDVAAQAAIDAKREAVAKAKAAGLTDADLLALGLRA